MNRPLRNDDTSDKHPGWNQSPNSLANDGVTRQDLNGIANLRLSRDHLPRNHVESVDKFHLQQNDTIQQNQPPTHSIINQEDTGRSKRFSMRHHRLSSVQRATASPSEAPLNKRWIPPSWRSTGSSSWKRIKEFASFVGPGLLIAVAYIDPGNYATDVAAGAATKFRLLFVVFMSNVFAVVLQSLAIRLGTVTGMDLAEHCRAHLPKWLNIAIYVLAEAAIIATDFAEVIGSAIALNLLFNVPLVAGCAITLVDVLLILLFYNPKGSLSRLRLFELFVGALVIAVVVCFCLQLSLIRNSSAGEVLIGYLPSSTVVSGSGIYLSCGILGATVMPHSVYLGSGLCQPRLQYYDKTNKPTILSSETPSPPPPSPPSSTKPPPYSASISAIKHCLRYSTTELILSLTGLALFVNSAILIVAGDSLSSPTSRDPNATADLFSIYHLLASKISPAAATIFASALFFSGTAAGIVCTIAGQMVSEGHLNWTLAPWLRRLLTRSISITPAIIIAASVGKEGLSAALTASQVALSVILPFVTAPLIWFTGRGKFMVVGANANSGSDGDGDGGGGAGMGSEVDLPVLSEGHIGGRGIGIDGDGDGDGDGGGTQMRNHVLVTILAAAIWLVITVMNIALLVLLGLGRS